VEWCNRSRSIKYLFKYIHKGVDYVLGLVKEKNGSNIENNEIKKILGDEVHIDNRSMLEAIPI